MVEGLNFEIHNDPNDASYYTEIDLLDWAKIEYGMKAAEFIEKNYTPFDILYDLAKNHSIILLNGDGFA